MAEFAGEVVIGATRKKYRVVFLDLNNAPIDITGGIVKLQGWSDDVAKTFNVTGAVYDGPNGTAEFAEIGGASYPQAADLGALDTARFHTRAYLKDAALKEDWDVIVDFDWTKPPAV